MYFHDLSPSFFDLPAIKTGSAFIKRCAALFFKRGQKMLPDCKGSHGDAVTSTVL